MEDLKLDYETHRFESSTRGQRTNRFERKVARQLLEKLPSSTLVIDVPCGMGRFSDIVIQQGHRYIGIDQNFDRTSHSSRRQGILLPTVQASIFELPLTNDSVDLILSIRMFHH